MYLLFSIHTVMVKSTPKNMKWTWKNWKWLDPMALVNPSITQHLYARILDDRLLTQLEEKQDSPIG